ncbi:hypothetical protein DXG01_013305 [Tephrocybe rancida]|nr:hypothetical protein DXG01_013305 [Tephrocybe rancida]
MDINGWHAQRRARKEDELLSVRRPDGRYSMAENISPMHEQFIGGFQVSPRPPAIPPPPHYPQPPPSPLPPAPPPKDQVYTHPGYQPGYHQIQTQLPPYHAPQPSFPGPSTAYQHDQEHRYPPTQSTITPAQLTQLSAVQRSQTLRIARMSPHLQFMVGPLLRYDTVDEFGIWHGAAMIVTADSGSIYEPHPTLTYEWDPDQSSHYQPAQSHRSFDLGPHPADPHSVLLPTSPVSSSNGYEDGYLRTPGSNASKEVVTGHELYVYGGPGGTFTFWRFLIQIPLGPREMNIRYSINSGQQLDFFVPGRSQNMRWAAHSCNGFSAGVNQDDFCGPGFTSGYEPVWMDVLAKHAERPFHALVGGGDQLYCDGLMREPELQGWIAMKPEEKLICPLSDELAGAIDRFYFNHYCQCFRRGAFARANSSIPMMNMCDDHETALDSKFNPLVAMGRSGTLGLSGFVNKFNAEAELLDDLKERNWFIEQMQQFALSKRIRVTFVSGDVHCAAVGVLKTLKPKGKGQEIAPSVDHRYMLNIVTIIAMVSSLATKVHRTMHYCETDETMIPLFQNETNGTPRKQKFIMGRRNWCAVDWDERSGDVVFDIRVEKEKGLGETVGNVVYKIFYPCTTTGLVKGSIATVA